MGAFSNKCQGIVFENSFSLHLDTNGLLLSKFTLLTKKPKIA